MSAVIFASLVALMIAAAIKFGPSYAAYHERINTPLRGLPDDTELRASHEATLESRGWQAQETLRRKFLKKWSERGRWLQVVDGVLCGITFDSNWTRKDKYSPLLRVADRTLVFMDLSRTFAPEDEHLNVSICALGGDTSKVYTARPIRLDDAPGVERLQAWIRDDPERLSITVRPDVVRLLNALTDARVDWSIRDGVLEFVYDHNPNREDFERLLDFVDELAQAAIPGDLEAPAFAPDSTANTSTSESLSSPVTARSPDPMGTLGFQPRVAHHGVSPWVERERHEALLDGVPCAVTHDSSGGYHHNETWRTVFYVDMSSVVRAGNVIIESNHPTRKSAERHGRHWEPLSIECGFHTSHIAAWSHTPPPGSRHHGLEPRVDIPDELARELYELADAGVEWMITRRTLAFQTPGRVRGRELARLLAHIERITRTIDAALESDVVLDMGHATLEANDVTPSIEAHASYST